jgi:hypothetical protein
VFCDTNTVGCHRFVIHSGNEVNTGSRSDRGIAREPRDDQFNYQTALKINEQTARKDEDRSECWLGKYQPTRYSQISAFGLTFQICEMCEESVLA